MHDIRERFEAVVFDLDGTLVDSAGDIAGALSAAFFHYDLPPVKRADVISMIGDGAGRLIDRALARVPGADVAPERVHATFLELYATWPVDRQSAFPGIEDMLGRLDEMNVQLGLCTNKPQAATRHLLDRMGWHGLFGAIAGGDTLPYRKPDGRSVTWVLGGLRAAPDRALMVGDNRNDIQAGREAGTATLLAGYGYLQDAVEDLAADEVVADPRELLAGIGRFLDAPRFAA